MLGLSSPSHAVRQLVTSGATEVNLSSLVPGTRRAVSVVLAQKKGLCYHNHSTNFFELWYQPLYAQAGTVDD
jgi:hypothetical protein